MKVRTPHGGPTNGGNPHRPRNGSLCCLFGVQVSGHARACERDTQVGRCEKRSSAAPSRNCEVKFEWLAITTITATTTIPITKRRGRKRVHAWDVERERDEKTLKTKNKRCSDQGLRGIVSADQGALSNHQEGIHSPFSFDLGVHRSR